MCDRQPRLRGRYLGLADDVAAAAALPLCQCSNTRRTIVQLEEGVNEPAVGSQLHVGEGKGKPISFSKEKGHQAYTVHHVVTELLSPTQKLRPSRETAELSQLPRKKAQSSVDRMHPIHKGKACCALRDCNSEQCQPTAREILAVRGRDVIVSNIR